MLLIGSHVSFSGGILSCVKEALSYDANTFMFYAGAPTNTIRSKINDLNTKEALELMKANNIDIKNVICHAPYIINLANKSVIDKYLFSINFLKEEIKRCEALGVNKIVLHPGSAVGISKEEGINNIAEALNKILNPDSKVLILLESMAGKGSECGNSIKELKMIIDGVNLKDKLGVCIDTCHLNDAGYDLNNFDAYLEEFDQIIGLEKIKCIHVNDSKNVLGAHKDRHENIGYGSIGFNTLIDVIYNKRLENVPKILETPYIDHKYPPYKFEIIMIKNKLFNPKLAEEVKKYYENSI